MPFHRIRSMRQQQQQPGSSSRVLINPTFPGSCIWTRVGVTWSLVSWSMAGLDSKAKWKGRQMIPLPEIALPQGIWETLLCRRTCCTKQRKCQPPSFAGAWLCESYRNKLTCHMSIPNNYCHLHRQRRGGKYFTSQCALGSCSSLTFFIREVSAAQSLKKERGTILNVSKWVFFPMEKLCTDGKGWIENDGSSVLVSVSQCCSWVRQGTKCQEINWYSPWDHEHHSSSHYPSASFTLLSLLCLIYPN